MSASFFARVQQVIVAGIGEAVDTAERSGSLGLMRQAMDEVERTIELHEREIRTAKGVQRDNAERNLRLRAELKTLEDNASFALSKDRPDLAKAAVKRQLDIEAQLTLLAEADAAAGKDERRAGEQLAAARERWQSMRAEFIALQKAHKNSSGSTNRHADAAEERLRRAEKVFERAAEAAGEAAGYRIKPDQAAELEAIHALRLDEEIAARLAAIQEKSRRTVKPAAATKRTAKKA